METKLIFKDSFTDFDTLVDSGISKMPLNGIRAYLRNELEEGYEVVLSSVNELVDAARRLSPLGVEEVYDVVQYIVNKMKQKINH